MNAESIEWRNNEIRKRVKAGESQKQVAEDYDISNTRVSQIMNPGLSRSKYRGETNRHIDAVKHWMGIAVRELQARAREHDESKLREPEQSGFMRMTQDVRLKDLVYGSDEYRAVLREHQPTIHHHYAENDHHPEYFGTVGIYGMSLISLLEMLCDWKASTTRMKGGDLEKSIRMNAERFGYDEHLTDILLNTARELGMVEAPG